MDEELKSCPWCGPSDFGHEHETYQSGRASWCSAVSCGHCGASQHSSGGSPEFAKRNAIQRWNNRAASPEMADLRIQLDQSCNAEELRQVRADRDRLAGEVDDHLNELCAVVAALKEAGGTDESQPEHVRVKALMTERNALRAELTALKARKVRLPARLDVGCDGGMIEHKYGEYLDRAEVIAALKEAGVDHE